MPHHKNAWIARQAVRVGVLAVVAALAGACSKSSAPGASGGMPPGGLPVTVLEVQPTKIPASVEVTAQTEGAREVEVRARVGGILKKRLYQEGTPVKAGQPLFQIDPEPYEIALADARAKAVQTAREMARLKGLVAQEAVSRKEYDDATSADAIAQANLKQAELNLSWTTVTAPISGMSGRTAKSEGNLVTVSTDSLLTTVYQINPIWVRFSLSDSEIAKLPGKRLTPHSVSGVELTLPDGSKYPLKGKINFLASQIDPTLGTQQLRAEFDNPDGKVLPGQFVRARVIAGERDNVFLVPQAAVMASDQGRFVMVAGAEGKAEVRPVQAGEWIGQDWVIYSGLKAGDKIIVDNLLKVRPGAPVAPHGPQPDAGQPTDAKATGADKGTPAPNAPAAPSNKAGKA